MGQHTGTRNTSQHMTGLTSHHIMGWPTNIDVESYIHPKKMLTLQAHSYPSKRDDVYIYTQNSQSNKGSKTIHIVDVLHTSCTTELIVLVDIFTSSLKSSTSWETYERNLGLCEGCISIYDHALYS